jgi:hypothetical protein
VVKLTVVVGLSGCGNWKRLEVEQVVRQDVAGVKLARVFFEVDALLHLVNHPGKARFRLVGKPRQG